MKDINTAVPPPEAPHHVEDLYLDIVLQRDLLIKTIFRQNLNSVTDIARATALNNTVVAELVDILRQQNMIETLGTRGREGGSTEMRYQLTESGKARAIDALAQSEYFGPFPVSLKRFEEQFKLQTVKEAAITREALDSASENIVLPDGMMENLGPAVNSGRSILLYGPPGNGKSSIANAIRDALGGEIYVPHVIEFSSQIISVFDPVVHDRLDAGEVEAEASALRMSLPYDRRFVRCKRPSVMTGGELTLDLLDLRYNPVSRTYQAPLQLKATGGVFIIDDLGRQKESPQAIINRWIVPMEASIDLLTLASGQKFQVPFDTLVIFSTNFPPAEMFDGAALRRIYYKIKVDRPSQSDFIKIFIKTSRAFGIDPDEGVLEHLINQLYPQTKKRYAGYHAPFLLSQMLSVCDYEGLPRHMSVDLLERVWPNLYVDDED
ncbi:MAG: ATPase [Pseudomonadota bacterium]